MRTNLFLIVLYLGLFQGLFLTLALLLLRNKRRTSIYMLISLIFCFSSLILIQILRYYLPESTIVRTLLLGSGIPLLIGPLLYFFVASVVDQQFRVSPKELIHLAPFLIVTLSSWKLGTNIIGSPLFLTLKSLHTFSYYLWILKLLSKKPVQKKLWYDRKLLKRLFQAQLWAFVTIHLIVILEMVMPSWQIESDLISSIIFIFFFFAFVLMIIVFPTGTLPDKTPPRYQQSQLQEGQKDTLKDQLIQLIKEEQLYLNPEITLNLVAIRMNVSLNHLSQVINETLQKNFNQLINEYRVEEVKRLIADEDKSLLAIAYASGFNSKSAFNRTFKEIEGTTPSAYRNTLKK